MMQAEQVLARGRVFYVNMVPVDEPDLGRFCETAPARELVESERFAQHEDSEADAYFEKFAILRKEKGYLEKIHGKGWLEQVTTEYIARKE